MTQSIQHKDELLGNQIRENLSAVEPRSLRTFTPTQAVIARSAGVFHWTPDGKRLFDFTSGVLVTNLGHNPTDWMERFTQLLGWPSGGFRQPEANDSRPYVPAIPLTAYNAMTEVEVEATQRLLQFVRNCPGGDRLESVMWAASGSEAIQKALWVAMARDRTRPMIIATRFGFHGKKGLANAVTGSENDSERDPRVRFISFPMGECQDLSLRNAAFDPAPFEKELNTLLQQFGRRIGTLITEPYLGGGGSYHPPKEYLQLLERFCRANDIVFLLDEVQSNFGRTGSLFAFETYGITPDIVVLGKGLGNGIPVAAAIGRRDLFESLDYGEASDTWSANPLSCAAVLATLESYEKHDVLAAMKQSSQIIEDGIVALKSLPFVASIRGEKNGMVWGVEMKDHAGRSASEWANSFVLACYHAEGAKSDGVHLLGPLSRKVVRIAPPLIITKDEAADAVTIIKRAAARLVS